MQQYLKLLFDILEKGTHKPAARAGMPSTISLFGYQFRHNMQDGFPLLTTKKMFWKGVVVELLWFLRGDTNIKYLVDNGVNIWNEDAYNFYCKLCKQWIEKPINFNDFIENVKLQNKKYNYTFGDCGMQYGIQWRNFGCKPEYKVQEYEYVIKNYNGSSGDLLKSTWEQMIERCYNPNNIGFKNYGGKGVSVHKDWFNFIIFKNDVEKFNDWDKKLKNWNNYQLDKDFNGDGFLYSKDTCKWISRKNNCSSSTEIFVFEKNNIEYCTNNLRTFSINNGGNHANYSRLISGERKTANGFKFVKIISKYNGIDQLNILIKNIKNNPESRRHLLTSWNPRDLNNLALHPCHCLIQFNCRPLTLKQRVEFQLNKDKNKGIFFGKQHYECLEEKEIDKDIPKYYLDLQWYQRSADVFLGVPFNIASYGLLLEIIAKMCNMVTGELISTYGDVHIYENHIEQVQEQLSRELIILPTIEFDDLSFEEDIDGLLDSIEYCGIERAVRLINYTSHPAIKAELKTGLK